MVEALEKMALKLIEVRRPVIDAVTTQLQLYPGQDEGLNGFLIEALQALRVRKAIPLIAEVFAAHKVEYLTATWESVAIDISPASQKRANRLSVTRSSADQDLPCLWPDQPTQIAHRRRI